MVRVAKVPYGIRISRSDGAAEILWREAPEAELIRVTELLVRLGEAATASEARPDENKGGKTHDGGGKP